MCVCACARACVEVSRKAFWLLENGGEVCFGRQTGSVLVFEDEAVVLLMK